MKQEEVGGSFGENDLGIASLYNVNSYREGQGNSESVSSYLRQFLKTKKTGVSVDTDAEGSRKGSRVGNKEYLKRDSGGGGSGGVGRAREGLGFSNRHCKDKRFSFSVYQNILNNYAKKKV